MKELTIVQASPRETELLSSILLEAANWLLAQGTPMWTNDEFSPMVLRPQVAAGMFWLAKVEGVAAGCVKFQLEDPIHWPDVSAHDAAFIHKLAVRREFAGGAVSGALLDWAKTRTHELGRKYLRLDCDAKRKKLQLLYEAHGFKKHSEKQVGSYCIVRYEFEI